MARPRRWAQGLSSPQTGKGAGEAGGERAAAGAADARQATDDRGGFRGIFKREKWKTGRRGLLSAMQRHTKVAVGKQAGGGAGRIRCDAGSYGQRQEAATRQTLRTGCCPIHRKKQPAQKPGDRHQGACPRAGQAVRDLMKRFWKGEGNRPKAAAGRARYDTAAMAKDRRGNETDAAYCCFINDFDVIAAAELRASRATLRGGEGEPFRRKGFPLPLA